jgi:hypothetical protein
MFANTARLPIERVRTQIAACGTEGKLDTAIACIAWRYTSPGPCPGTRACGRTRWPALYRRSNRRPDVEAWRLYLLDPRTAPDPTEPATTAGLGRPRKARHPESAVAGLRCHSVLGKFYLAQRRLPRPEGQFEQALQAAVCEKQKAMARTGLAYAAATAGGRSGVSTATRQSQHWVNVVETSSLDGDANYAQSRWPPRFTPAMPSLKGPVSVLQIKDSWSAVIRRAGRAFVRYRLVQEYICRQEQRREIDGRGDPGTFSIALSPGSQARCVVTP